MKKLINLCVNLYFLEVKALVDLGDAAKSDDLHEPAWVLSARFVSDLLKKKISELQISCLHTNLPLLKFI
jgi:hypothetical protein